jgi:tRNA 2-thiouridine synthesizing protein A
VDLRALFCPEPLMMLRQHVRQREAGDLLLVLATDPSTQRDIPAYCRFTSQTLAHEGILKDAEDIFCFLVQKG